MTNNTSEMSADLSCHRCGYDLRAHPPDGKCPECGESVAESRQSAAIPRRPAWRDSNPRWRRRMLTGAWVLVLLPLIDALQVFKWAQSIPVPTVFDYRGTVRVLDDTFLCWPGVYQSLVFCIGVVLLFSKEPGRRRGRLDWTRRWGVVCSYVALLLSVAQVLFIGALISVGVAAVLQSMPLKYQPEGTPWFVNVSTACLRYGPHPMDNAALVLIGFSSTAILLTCVPLFDALRSSGTKWLAAILVTPLALFALMHLSQAGRYYLGVSSVTGRDVGRLGVYFRPRLLVGYIADDPTDWFTRGSGLSTFVVEATKWCIVLAIALWLSIAQLTAWRQRKQAK